MDTYTIRICVFVKGTDVTTDQGNYHMWLRKREENGRVPVVWFIPNCDPLDSVHTPSAVNSGGVK